MLSFIDACIRDDVLMWSIACGIAAAVILGYNVLKIGRHDGSRRSR